MIMLVCMLRCVAVCSHVLQGVAVCYSVLACTHLLPNSLYWPVYKDCLFLDVHQDLSLKGVVSGIWEQICFDKKIDFFCKKIVVLDQLV